MKLQANFSAWLIQYASAMQRQGIRPNLMTLDPRVEEAMRLLDRGGRNLPRPAELSKQLGASLSQLNRLFLRQLGMALRGYGERQKLASAQMLSWADPTSA